MKPQNVYLVLVLTGAVHLFALSVIVSSSTFSFRHFPIMMRLLGRGEYTNNSSSHIKALSRHGVDGFQPPKGNNRSRMILYEVKNSKIAPRNSAMNVTPVGQRTNKNVSTPNTKSITSLQKNTLKFAGVNLYDRDDSGHINPHGYRLLKDEPRACSNTSGELKEVFLLVFILTVHAHFERRAAIRETWGNPREVDGKKIVTLFLLAHNEDAHLQRQVEEESSKHHDLLQEDFKDTYKNLTLKTMMGMKWAYSHCPHASYVMKTDDDMYVSYANLVKHLADTKTPSVNYATGFLINGGPIRDRKSKWYMPKEIYPETKYPPFLSGTGYVMSGDVARKIYEKSLDTKYLHLEDVFVAVCLESLNIKPKGSKNFNNWRTPYSYCRYRNLITTHMVPPSQMRRIWKDQERQIVC